MAWKFERFNLCIIQIFTNNLIKKKKYNINQTFGFMIYSQNLSFATVQKIWSLWKMAFELAWKLNINQAFHSTDTFKLCNNNK